MAGPRKAPSAIAASFPGTVLLMLASGQFLMALDSPVMNVSIATVATTSPPRCRLVVPGGCGCRVDQAGDRRAGRLELQSGRSSARLRHCGGRRGHRGGRGAVDRWLSDHAYASWRWVFAGEVLIVPGDPARGPANGGRAGGSHRPPGFRGHPAVGPRAGTRGVRGTIRACAWGFVNPKPGAPAWIGLSPVVWLVIAGGLVLLGFLRWEQKRHARGAAVLIDPAMLSNRLLRAD